MANAGNLGRCGGRNRSGYASAAETVAIGNSHRWEHSPLHYVEQRSAKIGVEILGGGQKRAAIDARLAAAFAEPIFRKFARSVVVTMHVEPVERRGRSQGTEMGGGERGRHGQGRKQREQRQHGFDAFAGGHDAVRLSEAGGITEPAPHTSRSAVRSRALCRLGARRIGGGSLGFARRQREPIARGDLVARERHGAVGRDFAVKEFLLGGERGFVKQSEPAPGGVVSAAAAGFQELKGAFRIEDDAGASPDRGIAAKRVPGRKPAPPVATGWVEQENIRSFLCREPVWYCPPEWSAGAEKLDFMGDRRNAL